MNIFVLAAAEASDANAGDAFFGLLLILGLVWLCCAAFSKKDKGYIFGGTIRKR